MTECPLCMEDLNNEELAYVESLDSDRNICFCLAAKSLAAKDREIAQKIAVIAHYRIGIDDLLNALRPHADDGDVEASNVMASLLSIKRTAHRKESKETERQDV